jgi:hypothetical protein
VAGGKEQLLQSAAREGSMAPWSLTGRKAEDLCHGRDDRLFSAHGGSSEMPPFHCALKVRHAVAQRAPQKQKLGLLRQGKGLALVDKRNNLLGSAAELSLYIVVVAYGHANYGETSATMLDPQRLGQLSNVLLVVGVSPPAEDARLVMARVEAYTAQAVGPVTIQDLKDSLNVLCPPHRRQIIKISDGGGSRHNDGKVVQQVLDS